MINSCTSRPRNCSLYAIALRIRFTVRLTCETAVFLFCAAWTPVAMTQLIPHPSPCRVDPIFQYKSIAVSDGPAPPPNGPNVGASWSWNAAPARLMCRVVAQAASVTSST